jgi:hypothetical protein
MLMNNYSKNCTIELSAFVLRTSAPVVPSCPLAHKLVLSGMATLEYVDAVGESCYVSYCPEPVLSNAARLFTGSLINFDVVLEEFVNYVDKRHVLDLGSSGEFVAIIIAMRALIWLLRREGLGLKPLGAALLMELGSLTRQLCLPTPNFLRILRSIQITC